MSAKFSQANRESSIKENGTFYAFGQVVSAANNINNNHDKND